MKYKDRNTLLIQSKHQSKETNEYGFPFESDREKRRRRKKQLLEFWSKNLKGFLSEDFWNALDVNEQTSIRIDFLSFEGGDISEFISEVKKNYHHKLQESRSLTLRKLGI